MCWDTNHIVLPLHSSVIVYYPDIDRALSRPPETDAILIVDPNAVLASSIVFERFQLVSTRYTKVAQQEGGVQMVKLTPCNITQPFWTRSARPGSVPAVEQISSSPVRERPDHTL